MNYRSAVVYGRAREVTDPERARRGSAARSRGTCCPAERTTPPSPREKDWRETLILAMPIAEASAKVRTGPPADDEADLTLDVWAGTLPLHTVVGEPTPSPDLRPGIETPDYLKGYRRP